MRFLAFVILSVTALCAVPAVAQDTSTDVELIEAEEPRQIYGYVDAKGAWHFVDSVSLVPVAYRAQARGNAVGVLAPDSDAAPPPAITKRVVRVDEDGDRATESQIGVDRRRKITDLQDRRIELLEAIAVLEEGSAPAALVDENEGEALTVVRLELYLTQTEEELDRIDAELRLLIARESQSR